MTGFSGSAPASGGVPAGFVMPSFVPGDPPGWFQLNGQIVSAAANPVLASLFGSSGDNVTLPDTRGSVLRMFDGSNAINTQAGSNTINLTHSHGVGTLATVSAGSHDHGGVTSTGSGSQQVGILGLLSPGAPANHTHNIASDGDHSHSVTGSTADGGNASADVRSLSTHVNYLIKAG